MRLGPAMLLLLVPAVTAEAQTHRPKAAKAAATNENPLALPIVKLTVEGNQQVPAAAILQFIGMKVGDTADRDKFEAARQKLVDSGMFDSVGFEYKPVSGSKPGYAAKFTVTEVKPLYPIQFAGFSAKNEELVAYLKSRDPLFSGVAPATEQIVKRWSAFLEEWTAAKNQPKKVVGKLLPTADGSFIVQFQPDEPLPAVARVEFTGNEAIDEATLQNTFGAVAYGAAYSEQNFRELLDNQLRPAYEAKGYMRVKFEDITTEAAPAPVKGLIVHMKVVEGPVFKLRAIKVTGVNRIDVDALVQLTGLKAGETVNFDAVNKSAEKLNKAERRMGYYRVATDVDRTIDEKAGKVDVVFKVNRGDKYLFGKLNITGLDLNGEDAVRKQWGKKAGDAFNPDYPDYFLSQVKDEGLFDYLGDLKAEIAANDATHVADVTLVFHADPNAAKKKQERKRPF